MSSRKEAVLLDTDIGSDIDDAVALAYLLNNPACDLLGVTTVSGDVQKRAALVEAVCHAAGKPHIPIHCGHRDVLVDGPGQPNVPQFDVIASSHPKLDRPENTAVEFLRQTIRQHPHEITLLTIGPYSNAALLFALDPEIPFLLKQTVSMGGIFFAGDQHEWNAMVDPAATAIVYNARRQKHLSVGLDVTLQCRMPAAEVRRRFQGEPLATVARLAEKWFEHSEELTFHDPLAATLIFHPELCTYDHGKVAISASAGDHTRLIPGEGPDSVAKTVDVHGFFEAYFSVFREAHA